MTKKIITQLIIVGVALIFLIVLIAINFKIANLILSLFIVLPVIAVICIQKFWKE